MKAKKQDSVEREYTISLREKIRAVPRYKKTNKAVRIVKEFLVRHMKIYDRDLNKIKIDKYLNEYLWFRGIRKPPYKFKVKARKEGEIVRVELAELPEKLKFKKAREEKREAKAKKLEKNKPAEKTEQTESKKEFEDKNKDGIEDKKEETEKKTAVIEAGQKFEKAEYKKQKHTTKDKMPTQEIQKEKTPKQNY